MLAKTYDSRTHSVYFISSDQYNTFVYENGYQVFDVKQFDALSVMQCSRNFDFSWLNHHDLEEVMVDQVRVIKEMKADLVIGDMAPTLKMAATLTGVKHISLMNAYMTPYYEHTRKISRSHRAYYLLQVFPEKVQNYFTTLGEKLAFRSIQKNFNQLRKKHGLVKIKDYLLENEGDETFICDSTEVFPLKPLPNNYKVIGPLFYETPGMEELPLDEAIAQRPVICVCMGSTGDWESLRFLNDVYYAKYAVVTTGDKKHVLSASHIIPFKFINLDQLLKKCFLMICHGGNGTIYTGIKNQVFMLCLPSHFEQEWNIAAIEKKGYGKSAHRFSQSMWKKEIDKQALNTAITVQH